MDIPGFEILEKVGAGGMATVWKARQVSLDRTVAIKILYSKFASDPADILRFQKEAQAAARLKHPGIVQVYDANALGDMYYFIMEYVSGYTVAEWIRRKGALSVGDALLVADCVADALGYAWQEARIIHCDVKPDNVLVDADGSVKVSDLGLARTLSHMVLDAASDEIMGTPAYIAPEQALGEGELDFRADIYALGASMYHMVTGCVPFGDKTPDEMLELQVSGTLPDPMDVNPEVPQQVAWLIEKMMCKDPAGRQASWAEVRSDLARAKKGLRPGGDALPEGVSTVGRSAARGRAGVPGMAFLNEKKPAAGARLARLVAVLVLAAAGIWLFAAARAGKLDSVLARLGISMGPPAAPVVDPAAAAAAMWRQDWKNAVEWIAAHPGRYDESLAMLTRIATEAAGTAHGEMTRAKIAGIQAEKQRAIAGVLERLQQVTAPMLAGQQFEEAAQAILAYAGEWAEETREERMARASDLRAQAATLAAAIPEPARPLETVLDEVVAELVGGKLPEALAVVEAAMTDPGFVPRVAELEALRAEVAGAAAADARILETFTRQKGLQVNVELRKGKRTLKVRDVRDGHVVAEVVDVGDAMAHGTIEFDVRTLNYPERLRRLGGTTFAGANLYLGLMAVEAGSTDRARRYFAQTPELIAGRLAEAVGKMAVR